MYTPNIGTPQYQYIRKLLTNIRKEIDFNTVVVGDCKAPLKLIDRSS